MTKPQPARRPAIPRGALWAAGALLAIAGGLALSSSASADTVINETSTSFLYTLDVAGSPYILSHDFSVLPGGSLFIGPGVELQVDSGAVIRGAGGDINVQGSASLPAVVRARPGAAALAWGGFVLASGSDLVVQNAVLHNGTSTITAGGGSTVWVDRSSIDGCGAWCVQAVSGVDVWLSNSTFADAVLGYADLGSDLSRGKNLTFTNFSQAAVRYGAPASRASLSDVRVGGGSGGIVAEGLVIASFSGLDVRVTDGPALGGNGSADVHVLDSTLVSDAGAAVDMAMTARLILEDSHFDGGGGALRLRQAASPELVGNTLTSSGGPCLDLAGATGAQLEGNALTACAAALSVPRGTAPPNATAGPSNTVDGKPFLWVDGGSDLVFAPDGSAGYGLAVFVSVTNVTVSDISLAGAGLFLFGCRGVTVERLLVTQAPVALTAVGSEGVKVVALRAEDVGTGLEAWSDASFPTPTADFFVERARVERASGAAFSFTDATNVTLQWVLVADSAVGVRMESTAGALVANLITRGAGTGVWLSNSTGVTLVDSSIEASTTLGLLANNTTGFAARNAFVENAEHASAPGSPSFAFNEVLAGNYWTNWSAPDANGDGWADIPYNLTDGTGKDGRPRVVRWDFHPTALPAAPAVAQLGQPAALDATPSFDDFQVAEFYWEVRSESDNATGQGAVFSWTPNATGVHTVTLSAVGSLGATDDYSFPVLVVDTAPPEFTFGPLGEAEAGTNLTVALLATDNDPHFPAGARVEWDLEGPGGTHRVGNASGLVFEVRIAAVGNHTLSVTLFDGSGNRKTASAPIAVHDTQPPEISITFEGNPDLALPFVLDAAQTFDPSGVDDASAVWSWVEDGATRQATGFPVTEVTIDHAGNYTVALHVCDLLGNCGESTVVLVARDTHGPRLLRVHIVAPQRDPVDFTPGQTEAVPARAGEEVVFEAFAEDPSGEVSFHWDFGDGTTAEGSRVVHRFAGTGELTVTLTMRDPLGNTSPAAFRMAIAPGGGFFGEIIPGVSGDLVVLVLVVGLVSVAALLYVRRRRPRGGGDGPEGSAPDPPPARDAPYP